MMCVIYRFLLIFIAVVVSLQVHAQITGGEASMTFLQLPQGAHISALGGMAISNTDKDIVLTTSNPALLRPLFHSQLSVQKNFYYAQSSISNVLYAFHLPKIQTTIAAGILYADYGDITQTDASGNIYGQLKSRDYALFMTASRAYLEKWRYGATIKWARSRLAQQTATALVADVGVVYVDTSRKISIGAVVKQAGFHIKNYEKGIHQPLPLDLQIGITKKFNKAPFSISALGHHLTRWDIRYDNPADKEDNQLLFADTTQSTKQKNYFADKLFRHILFSVEIHLGKRLELSVGYNHLRRSELAIAEKKGLSGFSMGGGLYLNKFIVHIAQSYYHIAGAYTEVGIALQLNQLFGSGQKLGKINWNEKFMGPY